MKKKLVTVLLGMMLACTLASCGEKDTDQEVNKEKEVSTEDKDKKASDDSKEAEDNGTESEAKKDEVKEEDSKGKTSSDLYQDFLDGKEKVYTDRATLTVYDYEKDELVNYFDKKDGYTLNELLKHVHQYESGYNERVVINGVNYTQIDLGADQEPEMALQVSINYEYGDVYLLLVIKNVDGKLQICYEDFSGFESETVLANEYGKIKEYGYAGEVNYFSLGYLDAEGKYQNDYTETIYYAPYYLDDRFTETEQYNSEDYWDVSFMIYQYCFEDTTDMEYEDIIQTYKYCNEVREDDCWYGFDEEESVKLSKELFEQAGEKLYTRAEIDALIAENESRLGLSAEVTKDRELSWKVVKFDEKEVNEVKEVSVTNVDELMAALQDNTEITLAPGEYNVTEWLEKQVADGKVLQYDPESYVQEDTIYYLYSPSEPMLVINGLTGCTISSADPKNPASIVCTPRDVSVVSFEKCKYLNLNNIVMGHTEGNDSCCGDVVELHDSYYISMDGCDLYGCGATGMDIYSSGMVEVKNSHIHDCSVGCLYVSEGWSITFEKVTFEDVEGYTMFSIYDAGIYFNGCVFKNLGGDMLSVNESYLNFENCTFDEGLLEEIEANPGYNDSIYVY